MVVCLYAMVHRPTLERDQLVQLLSGWLGLNPRITSSVSHSNPWVGQLPCHVARYSCEDSILCMQPCYSTSHPLLV